MNNKTTVNNDRLKSAQQKVDEVKEVMRDNIDRVMENTEQLHIVEHKSETLELQAKQFEQNSRKVKRRFCMQYAKTTCVLVLIILIVIFIIVMALHPWSY